MSKKFGTDKLDKWDKNLKNYEESEFYYSDSDVEDEEQENEDDRSTEHKAVRR